MMLDSGSSVSLIRQDMITCSMQDMVRLQGICNMQLVTASGQPLKIVRRIKVPVSVGNLELNHIFVVVDQLITSAILGIDFFHMHDLVLDFTSMPVEIHKKYYSSTEDKLVQQVPHSMKAIMDGERKVKSKACAVSILENPTERDIEDCMIPDFCQSEQFDIPTCQMPSFHSLVERYKALFCTTPGVTSAAFHSIPINGSPARVPPRRIPAHFRDEVENKC